jgi:hypothetical protein
MYFMFVVLVAVCLVAPGAILAGVASLFALPVIPFWIMDLSGFLVFVAIGVTMRGLRLKPWDPTKVTTTSLITMAIATSLSDLGFHSYSSPESTSIFSSLTFAVLFLAAITLVHKRRQHSK